jgi:hypothetical protein
MEHFVTICDSRFLPQGLALHKSLERHCPEFMLWVVCMDEAAHGLLSALALGSLRPLKVSELETPQLLEVKKSRTVAEYCWTLSPVAPHWVFALESSVQRVTYLDADMYFMRSPAPIFREFEASGKSVLITEHAYDAEYDQSAASGRYCVQFMTFVRDRSEPVRQWWEEKCLEWCHARVEDGRMGDQMYLDDWPERFPDHVHVLSQREVLMAPWNARRFPYSGAIAWHFQGLRLLSEGQVLLYRTYIVPGVVLEQVYRPYLQALRAAMDTMQVSWVQQSNADGLLRRLGRRAWRLLRMLRAGRRALAPERRVRM